MSQALQDEWRLLQHQHEQYEVWTLGIKLFAMLLCVVAFDTLWLPLLLALLWVQDAVLKTFQGRLTDRLLRIEAALRLPDPLAVAPMQLHSEWLATRPRSLGLLASYLRAASRPTVAFPYVMLMVLSLVG